MANNAVENWALPRLQQLLPLDDESLKQIIEYVIDLPKDAAADHLQNLLGGDPKALEFISSFNQRRQNAPASASSASAQHVAADNPQQSRAEMERSRGGVKKKKKNIHALPARQVAGQGDVAGGYVKRDEEDYMATRATYHDREQTHRGKVADKLALQNARPQDTNKMPLITDSVAKPAPSPSVTSKAPPSAAGPLISDALAPRATSSTSRAKPTGSNAKAKVSITGGTAMHGASTALSDLDSAIRSLEIQTNPSLASEDTVNDPKRRCNCMATRHPLLDIAPNCLNCGKIICVKQGIGPCVFCGSPLMSADDIIKVLRVLKDERGETRQSINNAAHKKADVAHGKSRALTGREFLAQTTSSRPSPLSSAGPATPVTSDDEATSKAKAHRDKLLNFQANNARRTRIHDEAADYDVPTSGTNMWASPAERAAQLKKQQKVLREMEWNARPEYEKRRVVASIDLKGGKVVRRMANIEKPDFSRDATDDEVDDYLPAAPPEAGMGENAGGAFSHNPLAKGLIRPKAREEKGKENLSEDTAPDRTKRTTWRRVQMEEDDNEAWILDGGLYGGHVPADRTLGAEEHAVGSC